MDWGTRSVRPLTLLSLYLTITILLDMPQARTLWMREMMRCCPIASKSNGSRLGIPNTAS
ncbi:hypothetical protein ARSEF1564_006126 [Beauveria bassiana]